MKKVAQFVSKLEADIVNLVEVEDCGILEELVTTVDLSGHRGYLRQGDDSATGQDVALLTKYIFSCFCYDCGHMWWAMLIQIFEM